MKNIILTITSIFILGQLFSQPISFEYKRVQRYDFVAVESEPTRSEMKVSVVSKNRDTLWLIDDSLGRLIGQVWDRDDVREAERPVIIYVKDLALINSPIISTKKKKIKKA